MSDVIEKMCEAHWNEMHCDGWSWREIVDGLAGNNDDVRRQMQDHASDLSAAMRSAIAILSKPENISDEMLQDFFGAIFDEGGILDATLISKEAYRKAISASIKAMLG